MPLMSWPFAPTLTPESQRPDICRIVFYLTGAPCTNLIEVHTRSLPLIGKWGVKPSSWDAPLWADVRRQALAGNWEGGGSSCKARGECTAGAPQLELGLAAALSSSRASWWIAVCTDKTWANSKGLSQGGWKCNVSTEVNQPKVLARRFIITSIYSN